MICRSSTRNPVQVRAVQFYSSLVDTNGCGHVWRDSGRVRPATVIGLRPAAAQLRPENSAGCGFGQMSRIKCHALLGGSTHTTWPSLSVHVTFASAGDGTWLEITVSHPYLLHNHIGHNKCFKHMMIGGESVNIAIHWIELTTFCLDGQRHTSPQPFSHLTNDPRILSHGSSCILAAASKLEIQNLCIQVMKHQLVHNVTEMHVNNGSNYHKFWKWRLAEQQLEISLLFSSLCKDCNGLYCSLIMASSSRAAQHYIVLQYIVTNTIYCLIKSIVKYCIVVPKFCNILYCWSEVLQYIVSLIWSIAIYCIAELKYCNILYCWIKVLQYIVLSIWSIAIYCIAYSWSDNTITILLCAALSSSIMADLLLSLWRSLLLTKLPSIVPHSTVQVSWRICCCHCEDYFC